MLNEVARQRRDCLGVAGVPLEESADHPIVARSCGRDADRVGACPGGVEERPSEDGELIGREKRNHDCIYSGIDSGTQGGIQARATSSMCLAHNNLAAAHAQGERATTGPSRKSLSDNQKAAGKQYPVNQPLPLLWDQAAWQRRIRDRVEQLGLPAQTLIRQAGGQTDEIRTQLSPRNKGTGPNVNVVMRIAKALRWTIGQAMGTQDPTLMLDSERLVDPLKLMWAATMVDEYYMTGRGTDSHYIEKTPAYANAVSLVYQVLSEEEAEGRSPDPGKNPTLHSALRTLLRQL